MLRHQVRHLDAILLTHEHNDHVIGLDDIRPFNFSTGHPMAVYALPRVGNEVRRRFDYIFGEPIPGLPRIELIPIDGVQHIRCEGINIVPVEVMHGRLPILGFRIGSLAYLTDVKTVSETEKSKLKGLKHLIVSALHHQPHPTHMNLEESLQFIEALQPEQAWLTHISHQMGLSKDVSLTLPPNVTLAYDGLTIDF